MTERDQQTDEHLKQMAELMHRRDTDVDKRMVDLLTTVQGLTLGAKAVVTQIAAVPSRRPPMPVAFNSANVPSTSAFPTQKHIYQSQSQQNKQPELKPPAMYKKGPPTNRHVPKPIQTDSKFCEVSGPPSIDPFARGASTTGDHYSMASGHMTSDVEYRTATRGTEYHTAASSNPTSKHMLLSFGDSPSRPLASSPERKPTSKKV